MTSKVHWVEWNQLILTKIYTEEPVDPLTELSWNSYISCYTVVLAKFFSLCCCGTLGAIIPKQSFFCACFVLELLIPLFSWDVLKMLLLNLGMHQNVAMRDTLGFYEPPVFFAYLLHCTPSSLFCFQLHSKSAFHI